MRRTGPRTVVCGSFHRALSRLQRDHRALLAAGCQILSPVDIAFVAEEEGFVFAAHELGEDPHVIEERHIAALQEADMVWLHSPAGYVGASAALELGVAHALGVPVFSREPPEDGTLRHFVRPVGSVQEAVTESALAGAHTPSRPLAVLQKYYRRIADERGYSDETPQDTMLLLTEEVGELARAVRKTVGLARAGGYGSEGAAEELADVQLYVLHLANILNVPLDAAVADKERQNAAKVALRDVAA